MVGFNFVIFKSCFLVTLNEYSFFGCFHFRKALSVECYHLQKVIFIGLKDMIYVKIMKYLNEENE